MTGYLTTSEPAIFKHARMAYGIMSASSIEILVGGENYVVWEGFGTALIESMDLSNTYYTKIFNLLKDLGCVQLIQRGGGGTASQWKLIKPPSDSDLNEYRQQGKTNVSPDRNYVGSVLEDLKHRIFVLETKMRTVSTVLINLGKMEEDIDDQP